MENNFKETLLDVIPPPLSRDESNKIVLWLNRKDLYVLFGIISFFSIIWIPLLITKFIIASISILAISLFIGLLLVYPLLNNTTRLYKLIFRSFKHSTLKTGFVSPSLINENQLIVKKGFQQKHFIKIYRITGIDTELIDDSTKMSLYSNLTNFFETQTEDKMFDLVKIDSNNMYSSVKYTSKNPFISKFIEKNNGIYEEFSYNRDKKTPKLLLIVRTKKEIDNQLYSNQLSQLLKRSRLNIQEANENDIEEILNNIWFENKHISSTSKYLVVKNKSNNEIKYVKYLAITELPKLVGREWMEQICNINNISFILKSSLYDENRSKKLLDKAVANAKSETLKNKSSINQEQEDLLNYEILTDIASKVAKTKARFLSNQMFITIDAPSKKELDSKVRRIIMELKHKGCYVDRLINNQLEAFNSVNWKSDNLNKEICYDILSSTLGFGFPYLPLTRSDANSFILGIDNNNQVVAIDWSKRLAKAQNSNIILQGMSGGGKTTTAKEIMLSQIASNKFNIYIIDPENEYGSLIKECGGENIDLSNPKNFINPFHFIPYEEDDFEFSLDNQLENNSIFFKFILEEHWNVSTKIQVLNACKKLYKSKNNEFTFSDLYKELSKNKKIDEKVLGVIELYTKDGVYGRLWDKKTNIKLSNNILSFNFEDITSSYSTSYKETKMFLLLKFLEYKVYENRKTNKNRFISIYIDEGHLFTSSKMSEVLEFVFNWYKRIRKYYGMMCFITQNINDLLGNKDLVHLTSAIVNNSFYWIFLKLSANEVSQLDKLLIDLGGLSDSEKEYLITADAGQAILFIENIRSKMNVIKKI